MCIYIFVYVYIYIYMCVCVSLVIYCKRVNMCVRAFMCPSTDGEFERMRNYQLGSSS